MNERMTTHNFYIMVLPITFTDVTDQIIRTHDSKSKNNEEDERSGAKQLYKENITFLFLSSNLFIP